MWFVFQDKTHKHKSGYVRVWRQLACKNFQYLITKNNKNLCKLFQFANLIFFMIYNFTKIVKKGTLKSLNLKDFTSKFSKFGVIFLTYCTKK